MYKRQGPGFGGSCFKKDILNLVYLAEYFGLPEVASFWLEVVKINNWHQHRIAKLIIKKLFAKISKNPAKFISKEHLSKNKYRSVSDFISGMTDRYAINLYNDIK